MATRSPNKLRYVQCELPDDVARTISDFEDAFDDSLAPFYQRLADIVTNDLPVVQAELDKQIALREQLLTGSPVQSLSSLAAVDASTNLTSPKRDDTDPTTIRIDERKLGAGGLCLLNGVIYKIINGDKLTALRHLWEVAGGDYDYFVRLGTVVYNTPLDSYNLFEYNTSTPAILPFVNKGFTYLDSIGLKNSQFKHRMLWTRGVSSSYALKTKMTNLGYSSSQINNMFSGLNPNSNFDYIGVLGNIRTLIRSIARLVLLPSSDATRQPPWENEANYIQLAIQQFLLYRTNKYTTSSFFDTDFWLAFLDLKPGDIEELLVYRPEIKNIELPQDIDSITAAVEKAISVPAESTIINTYMNNLPVGTDQETSLTNTLYDLGLAIYKQLIVINSTRAPALRELLIELIGQPELIDFINGPISINYSDISALFPTTNLPPAGPLMSVIKASPNSALINYALSANSSALQFSSSESKTIQKLNLTATSGSTTNNTPSGTTQGFPTEDTLGMILSRRVKWLSNFQDCSGNDTVVGISPTALDQQMAPVASFDKTSTDTGAAEWVQYNKDVNYIKTTLEDYGITLDGDSVSDLRIGINQYLDQGKENGLINKSDARINRLSGEIYSSNDIKEVASKSVTLLKALPKAPASSAEQKEAPLPSGYTLGKSQYAAKNRNEVESAGGGVPPGDSGLSANEVAGLENTLGRALPFVGTNNKGAAIPFHASNSVELQVCQSKVIKELDNFLKGLLQPPAWLVRFINIVKQQIITFQDRIDKFILAVQTAMDAVMAKLERLLTLDLNFSGKIGFDNSLLKCSWGIDLGLKIDLLGLLLSYLNAMLSIVFAPILKFLQLLQDFINEILCIPIRWLQTILNGGAAALSALLSTIGCTLKDFKLPTGIFDILGLLSGIFNLRSLVLRKGNADWLKMMGRLKKGKNEFTGLSQFANMCAPPHLSSAVSALQSAMGLGVSSIPVPAAGSGNLMAGSSSALSNVV
jgi:hypothetical protein